MGVKAIYIWACLLVPTTIILYFLYPEVSKRPFYSPIASDGKYLTKP